MVHCVKGFDEIDENGRVGLESVLVAKYYYRSRPLRIQYRSCYVRTIATYCVHLAPGRSVSCQMPILYYVQ